MKQRLVNIGKLLLLVLFISNYISVTAFHHTHYFSWGTVTHSHPYLPFDKSPEGHANHTHHTQGECVLISILSNIVLTGGIITLTLSLSNRLFIRKIHTWVGCYKSYAYSVFSPLRAPPATVS